MKLNEIEIRRKLANRLALDLHPIIRLKVDSCWCISIWNQLANRPAIRWDNPVTSNINATRTR